MTDAVSQKTGSSAACKPAAARVMRVRLSMKV
jgi:hypothetical protein